MNCDPIQMYWGVFMGMGVFIVCWLLSLRAMFLFGRAKGSKRAREMME